MNEAPRGGEEMLGQQIARAVGGLDGPDAPVIGRGPLDQLLALAPSRSDPQGGELEFLVVERHRGVGALVGGRSRSSPSASRPPDRRLGETVVGTPDSRWRGASLFRATPRARS